MKKINKKLLTPNPYSRPLYILEEVKGIIVHWVANPGTSAMANRNYFENRKYGRILCKLCEKEFYAYEASLNGRWECPGCESFNLKYLTWKNFVSTHFIIGLNGEIIQNIPLTEITYHTGKITNKTTIEKLGKTPNLCTIGIECCHLDMNGKMNRITYTSLSDLVVFLMKRYNLNVYDNLFLHWHIYGKDCHKWFVENPVEWDAFKLLIKGKLDPEVYGRKYY